MTREAICNLNPTDPNLVSAFAALKTLLNLISQEDPSLSEEVTAIDAISAGLKTKLNAHKQEHTLLQEWTPAMQSATQTSKQVQNTHKGNFSEVCQRGNQKPAPASQKSASASPKPASASPKPVQSGPTNHVNIVVKEKTVAQVHDHVPPKKSQCNQQGGGSKEPKKPPRNQQGGWSKKPFVVRSNFTQVPASTGKKPIPGLVKVPSNNLPKPATLDTPEKKPTERDESREPSEIEPVVDDAKWENVRTGKKSNDDPFSSIMKSLNKVRWQIHMSDHKTVPTKRQSWLTLISCLTAKCEHLVKESTNLSIPEKEKIANIHARIVHLNCLIETRHVLLKMRHVISGIVPCAKKFFERRCKMLETSRPTQTQIFAEFNNELKKFPQRYKPGEISAAKVHFKNSIVPHKLMLDMTPDDGKTPWLKLSTNSVAVTVDISLWGTMFTYWTACMQNHCRIPREVYENIKRIIAEKKAFDQEMRKKKASKS